MFDNAAALHEHDTVGDFAGELHLVGDDQHGLRASGDLRELVDRLVYYYAHMDGYHERLAEGMAIQRGDTLGFVGSTGNARENEPHLHFQVMRMPEDRRRYWDGEPINPFEVLAAAGAATATPVTQAGDERP